jgi:hypothetical protein
LDAVPRTLDSFYHRLLDDVSEEHFEIVGKALSWLLFAARALTLTELAEAVIVESTRPYLDLDERFDDEECLLEILPPGFIRYDGNGSRRESSLYWPYHVSERHDRVLLYYMVVRVF